MVCKCCGARSRPGAGTRTIAMPSRSGGARMAAGVVLLVPGAAAGCVPRGKRNARNAVVHHPGQDGGGERRHAVLLVGTLYAAALRARGAAPVHVPVHVCARARVCVRCQGRRTVRAGVGGARPHARNRQRTPAACATAVRLAPRPTAHWRGPNRVAHIQLTRLVAATNGPGRCAGANKSGTNHEPIDEAKHAGNVMLLSVLPRHHLPWPRPRAPTRWLVVARRLSASGQPAAVDAALATTTCPSSCTQ